MPFFTLKRPSKYNVNLSDLKMVKKNIKNRVLTIPDFYEVIIRWAFSDCNKFDKLIVNEKMRTIEDYAFAGCHTLKEVYLPKNVEFIGSDFNVKRRE